MKTIYNRFSLIPHECYSCRHYIWFESYRRTEIFNGIGYIHVNLCKGCAKDKMFKEEN